MTSTPKNNLSPDTSVCGAAYQTFCNINGQTVQDNMTITYTNNVIAQQTYNLAEVWNEIQDAMKAVYNLGEKGTRNPDISGLTDKQKNDYTTLSYYNSLLTKIGKTNLTGSQYIKALDFVNYLQNGIKEYELNSDRCNVCNNSCQYCDSCQTTAQTCGSCYTGEGGGTGCCDGSCCMVGHWGCGGCEDYQQCGTSQGSGPNDCPAYIGY